VEAQKMKNVEMKLEGDILTIKVDVTKEFGPSASGKTIIIATTEGNISIPDKDEIKIGLNVYRKTLLSGIVST
jgi:ABC-type molybdate transport system ATPase subunit